jgi:hypothetical protein
VFINNNYTLTLFDLPLLLSPPQSDLADHSVPQDIYFSISDNDTDPHIGLTILAGPNCYNANFFGFLILLSSVKKFNLIFLQQG